MHQEMALQQDEGLFSGALGKKDGTGRAQLSRTLWSGLKNAAEAVEKVSKKEQSFPPNLLPLPPLERP